MELVQPIRSKEKIQEVKDILKKNGYRDFLLFVAGISTGLRISDLLKLKVSDVRLKTHITIREQKTGKTRRFKISGCLAKHIEPYTVGMKDDDFLFQSKKGDNQAITRVQAYRIINTAAKKAGITDDIGTHTLRKTFGYHHYQQFKDVAILQDIFNHSAPSITLRYIGITDDMKDETIDQFDI